MRATRSQRKLSSLPSSRFRRVSRKALIDSPEFTTDQQCLRLPDSRVIVELPLLCLQFLVDSRSIVEHLVFDLDQNVRSPHLSSLLEVSCLQSPANRWSPATPSRLSRESRMSELSLPHQQTLRLREEDCTECQMLDRRKESQLRNDLRKVSSS